MNAPETPSVALTDEDREALTGAIQYARAYWRFGTEPKTQAALTTLAAAVDRLAARVEADRAAVEAEALRAAATEAWHLFLLVPNTPSPLGDRLQRHRQTLLSIADRLDSGERRASGAEAAVERVRALADDLDKGSGRPQGSTWQREAAKRIRAALAGETTGEGES